MLIQQKGIYKDVSVRHYNTVIEVSLMKLNGHKSTYLKNIFLIRVRKIAAKRNMMRQNGLIGHHCSSCVAIQSLLKMMRNRQYNDEMNDST